MTPFSSIVLTIFFVINALGNIPSYISAFKKIERKKRVLIEIRELIFALIIMVAFQYVGQILLTLLDISRDTVEISGGLILFLIAIRLIFPDEHEKPKTWEDSHPFIVPIATPLIAGPSVLAIIMIYSQEQPEDLVVILAISIAWFFSSLIYFFSEKIYRLIGDKALTASQRLMGLILALISIQMFLRGVEHLFHIVE